MELLCVWNVILNWVSPLEWDVIIYIYTLWCCKHMWKITKDTAWDTAGKGHDSSCLIHDTWFILSAKIKSYVACPTVRWVLFNAFKMGFHQFNILWLHTCKAWLYMVDITCQPCQPCTTYLHIPLYCTFLSCTIMLILIFKSTVYYHANYFIFYILFFISFLLFISFYVYFVLFSIILHCPWSGPDSHFTAG